MAIAAIVMLLVRAPLVVAIARVVFVVAIVAIIVHFVVEAYMSDAYEFTNPWTSVKPVSVVKSGTKPIRVVAKSPKHKPVRVVAKSPKHKPVRVVAKSPKHKPTTDPIRKPREPIKWKTLLMAVVFGAAILFAAFDVISDMGSWRATKQTTEVTEIDDAIDEHVVAETDDTESVEETDDSEPVADTETKTSKFRLVVLVTISGLNFVQFLIPGLLGFFGRCKNAFRPQKLLWGLLAILHRLVRGPWTAGDWIYAGTVVILTLMMAWSKKQDCDLREITPVSKFGIPLPWKKISFSREEEGLVFQEAVWFLGWHYKDPDEMRHLKDPKERGYGIISGVKEIYFEREEENKDSEADEKYTFGVYSSIAHDIVKRIRGMRITDAREKKFVK